jgi:hypothetical protein
VCGAFGLRLTLADQRHEIGFEALAVFNRMAQQELDQPAFAGPKVTVHPAARQSVQESDRLLDE